MRWQRVLTVVATVLVVAIGTVALLPILANHAQLGLDLQGGVMVRLEAPEGTSDEDMNGAIEVINNRVNALGVTEPEVRREGANRISVELPGAEDPEEAVRVIGTTAKLDFVRYDNQQIILGGSELKKASAYINQEAIDPRDQIGVSLEFNSSGATKFAEATKELVTKYPNEDDMNRGIAIILDGEILSMPLVKSVINNGEARISGSFTTKEEATQLALMLNHGSLPVQLEIVEKRMVGPQLGQDSIDQSMNAAIIGMVVLAIFMIGYYRIPGMVAMLSLALYAMILGGALVAIKATITLPVIAAFLLSIGMGVDANIIIYERIKDELKSGKTLRVAVEAGFKKAFATILDSNVTTLIGGVVLIAFGSGPIRGFALTLSIGIIASMFTAITFTRFFLKQLVASKLITNTKYYGA